MVYDEDLADRIRAAVHAATETTGYREIRMFGGLCWTVNTHMAVGAAWVGPAVKRAQAKPSKPPKSSTTPKK